MRSIFFSFFFLPMCKTRFWGSNPGGVNFFFFLARSAVRMLSVL